MGFARKYFSFIYNQKVYLFFIFCVFTLLINLPIINSHLLYFEQPSIYLANHAIHSLSDFFKVYASPQLFDIAIPFFRPAGHFLIYQIITPIFGWHNIKILTVINLIFLASTGFILIYIYRLLFPRFKNGAYIAFAFYLMQPALILPRMIVLHFEFAYIFFIVLSFYYFLLFCRNNYLLEAQPYYSCEVKKIKFQQFNLLSLSLLFFVIAATFKEPSIALGPLLIITFVFLIYFQNFSDFFKGMCRNKEILQIILLLSIVTVVLVLYLTIPWHGWVNKEKNPVTHLEIWLTLKHFMRVIFAIPENIRLDAGLYASGATLRSIKTPVVTHLVTWALMGISFISLIFLIKDRESKIASFYRQSILFLIFGFFIFLILPVFWAVDFPWHLSPSLLFLSLLIGFCFEYFFVLFVSKFFKIENLIIFMAILIGSSVILVNKSNLHFYSHAKEGFAYKLNQKAVFSPPHLMNLNKDSVLIVEDSMNLGDYALGNGAYPFYTVNSWAYKLQLVSHRYLKYDIRFGGSLFRWAYLMPNLKEELFPFQIQNMKILPPEEIHFWLSHFKNIFCVGYDKKGNWFDRTKLFKQKLLLENKRRNLLVSSYRSLQGINMLGSELYSKNISVPDPELCKYECDQNVRCKGFTLFDAGLKVKEESSCHFYRSLNSRSAKPCSVCQVHIKQERLIG